MKTIRQLVLGYVFIIGSNPAHAQPEKDFFDLSPEELMTIEVTSVSKKAQHLSDAAAAIFVITHEDIKRSGATNIPDVLRMAPGLEVSRIDANKWAVSARGFNGRFANKLLVLIDGRSTYTQAFSGVYWEMQDVMLDDIDRIEVIRGPGAALWGANAVNGVINIITKRASDTQGGLVTGGGGTEEQGFGAVRYGADIGKDTSARIYMKGFNRDQFKLLNDQDAKDNWTSVQGGFRIDSNLSSKDSLTVSGDAYTSEMNQSLFFASLPPSGPFQDVHDATQATGGNLRSRFEHTISPTSNYALQFYYDIYDRKEIFNNETRQTIDIEFQHDFELNTWNNIAWGGSYRYTDSESKLPLPDIFSVGRLNPIDHYFSTFFKDEITLIDDELWLTIGTKLEHNDYTGFEAQPTIRLLWAPNDRHRFWGAISRAVRTPSVIDDTLRLTSQFIPPNNAINPAPLPMAVIITGSNAFRAEELLAFELGYRLTLAKALSVDTTAFYNDYNSLRSYTPGAPALNSFLINQPLVINNNSQGHTFGIETSVVWQMSDWWRWDLTYSFLKTELEQNQFYRETVSPQHKTSLRSVITPSQNVNLDFWLRYVDESTFFNVLGPQNIGSYVTLDARLAWKPVNNIELSVTGQNLLDSYHLEAVGEAFAKPTEIPRSVYGKIALEF